MKNKYATIKYEFTPEFIQYLRKTVGSMPPETGLIGGSSDGYHMSLLRLDSPSNRLYLHARQRGCKCSP